MSKNILKLFILSLLVFAGNGCAVPQVANAGLPKKTIYLPAGVDKAVIESANDMAYWLQKAGAGEYSVVQGTEVPPNGIRLVPIMKTDLPNVQRAEVMENGQRFHLLVNGINDVRIAGSGKNSYINGIYTFLHELGFRWYMPGDLWAKLGDVHKDLRINRVYTPEFRDRQYSGSGGANAIPGLDEKDSFSVDFLTWNRRNRLSVDLAGKGHAGIAFYNANKDVLTKHPEYYCNGKITRNGRLNFDNRDLVKLFVDWSVSQVKPADPFPVIGVDPADGSGGQDDCLPKTIPGIKTWSDKYFWMANQVAAGLPASDNKTKVMMYAYNQHADVPSFPLHKNVFPVIIPYAFQDVTTPNDFIDRWVRKMNGREMGIYDYWNITQWSQCVPQFSIYEIPTRLRRWKESRINSIYLESTYAKGPMGHSYWLATQMMWNTGLDFDTLFNEFLVNNFGEAAGDIRRMYHRWSTNYQWAAEAILSNDDLARASAKVKDPLIRQRIAELKAYVRYIRLFEIYKADKTEAGYEELIRYVLSIHHLRMLHTSALISLYIPKPFNYKTITDRKQLAAKYGAVKPLSFADIERNFERDRKTDPPGFSISSLRFDIKKIKPAEGISRLNAPLYLNNTATYQFYMHRAGKVVIGAGASKETRMLVKNESGKIVYDRMLPATKEGFEDITLTLPEGAYSLQWGEPRRFSRIRFPKELAVVSQDHGYDNAGFPWQYVYVPSDVSEIVYHDMLGPGINQRGFWLDPDGNKVQATKLMGTIYQVKVPPKYRGKVWVLNIGHRTFKMLNIPDFYSLNPFTYSEK